MSDTTAGAAERAWSSASLADLMAHIVARHHAFLREELPAIDEIIAQFTRSEATQHARGIPPLRATRVVRSTHGVNCTGGCSWIVHVKDGIVTWEMQATDYPRLEPGLPFYSGAANMPSYVGNIAPNDLNALLSFLESRRRKPAPQLRHAAD